MTILKSLIYVIILGFIFCDANIHAQPEQNKIENPRVIPEHINVGPFFKGLKAIVNAEIPKCAGVIVKLIGKNKEMVLNIYLAKCSTGHSYKCPFYLSTCLFQ
jgi:hypothetical protein